MSKSTNCDCKTKKVLGKTFIINMCNSCKKELLKRDFIDLVKVDTLDEDTCSFIQNTPI
jgi:hypothetical protein